MKVELNEKSLAAVSGFCDSENLNRYIKTLSDTIELLLDNEDIFDNSDSALDYMRALYFLQKDLRGLAQGCEKLN